METNSGPRAQGPSWPLPPQQLVPQQHSSAKQKRLLLAAPHTRPSQAGTRRCDLCAWQGQRVSPILVLCIGTGQPGGAPSTRYGLKGRQQRPGGPASPGEEHTATQGPQGPSLPRCVPRLTGEPRAPLTKKDAPPPRGLRCCAGFAALRSTPIASGCGQAGAAPQPELYP